MQGNTKKHIRNRAHELIAGGKSHQEVYAILSEQEGPGKELANVIRYIPGKQDRDKFGIWNNVLLGLLIIAPVAYLLQSGLDTVNILPIFTYYALAIYTVMKMKLRLYPWVAALAVIVMLTSVAVMVWGGQIEWLSLAVITVLHLRVLVLSVWLQKRLGPQVSPEKEVYIDEEGMEWFRLVFRFENS